MRRVKVLRGLLMHHELPRVRALPVLAHNELQSVGRGVRGGKPEVAIGQ
jgi:hypothetical protein